MPLDSFKIQVPGTGRERAIHFRPDTHDRYAIDQVFRVREYDLTQMPQWPRLEALLKRQHAAGRQPLIVDAGAHIGASAVYFAVAYPMASVVAIEPQADNFALMQKNVEGLRVRGIHGALASAPGSFQVTDPGKGTWAYRTQRTERAADAVPAVTIPDLFEAECGTGGLFPFIVKIDIEGGEHDVFSAATDWLAATPVLFLEPHDWLSPGARIMQPVLKCLADADRDFVVYGENIISISNQLPG